MWVEEEEEEEKVWSNKPYYTFFPFSTTPLLTSSSNQIRLPPELKHINKGRKRN